MLGVVVYAGFLQVEVGVGGRGAAGDVGGCLFFSEDAVLGGVVAGLLEGGHDVFLLRCMGVGDLSF